ncbi:putative protein MSS51 homolog, mitochondrial isoform X3 [Belonocnema kinseyi]|nr:putative protein MSS51 homolog, mitochondrial isoform X3 [Belonocnema kinseyi]
MPDDRNIYKGQEDELRKRHVYMKVNLIYLMEKSLKRELEPYENEMIEYSKVCEVCYETDINLLRSCPDCPHANFCTLHKGDPTHGKFCSNYRKCFLLDYYAIVFQENPSPRMMEFTPDNFENTRLPNSMQKYLDIFYKPREGSQLDISHEDVKMYVSQHFTRPLTLIFAMDKIGFKPESEFTIHVIGASKREENSAIEWEILFHWLPQLMNLKVALVGPELSNRPLKTENKSNLCDKCAFRGKTVEVEIHSTLYESYCKGKYFVQPDIIIGFNLGIIAYRSWKNSILEIANLNCPFVLTAFSEREAEDDYKIMCWEFETSAKVERNPFASLRPKRSPIGDKVFYENQFFTVYNDLDQSNVDKVEKEERKL